MPMYATHARKPKEGDSFEAPKALSLAATISAVRTAIVKEENPALHDKEITCCVLATD